MFGLGLPELLLVLVVLLIFVGPSRLPEMARSLGKGVRELRKASRELEDVEEFRDLRRTVQDLRRPLETLLSDDESVRIPSEAPPVVASGAMGDRFAIAALPPAGPETETELSIHSRGSRSAESALHPREAETPGSGEPEKPKG